MLKKTILVKCCLVLWILISGCSSSKINVSSKENPGNDISRLNDFGIIRLNAAFPQVEGEILTLVQEELEKKGLSQVNSDPDFLVVVYFYSGSYEEYIPPSTFVSRTLGGDWTGNRERVLTGMGARRSQADRMASGISKTRYTFDGYTETGYYKNIQVFFIKELNNHTMNILWRGEADIKSTKEEKLLALAPKMIDQMIAELPY